MKRVILIIAAILGPGMGTWAQSGSGAVEDPDLAEYTGPGGGANRPSPDQLACKDLMNEIHGLDVAMNQLGGAHQLTLGQMKQKYDALMADYVILEGLKAVKANYLKLLDPQTRQMREGEGPRWEGDVSTRYMNMFQPARDAVYASARVLTLSLFLQDLEMAKSKPEDAEKKLEQGCQQQAESASALCKWMQANANNKRKMVEMARGFIQNFATASDGTSEENKKDKLDEYFKLLHKDMPAPDEMLKIFNRQDELSKKVAKLEEMSKAIKDIQDATAGREKSGRRWSDAQARSAAIRTAQEELQKGIQDYQAYVGKIFEKNPALKEAALKAGLEDKVGPLAAFTDGTSSKNVADILTGRRSNKLLGEKDLRDVMGKYAQHARLSEVRKKAQDPSYNMKAVRPGDKALLEDFYYAFEQMAPKLRSSVCPSFSPDDYGLLDCVKYMHDKDTLDRAIGSQKSRLEKLAKEIEAVKADEDYKKMAAMQAMLLEVAQSGPCLRTSKKLEIQQCVGEDGLPYGAGMKRVDILVDDTGQIISAMAARAKGLPQGNLAAVTKKLEALCKHTFKDGGGMAKFSPRTCHEARVYVADRARPTMQQYAEQRDKRYYPDGRPRDQWAMIAGGAARGLANNLPGLLYVGLVLPSQTDQMYQQGLAMKQEQYYMQQWQQWQYNMAFGGMGAGFGYPPFAGVPGYPPGYMPGGEISFMGQNPMLRSGAAAGYYGASY